MDEKLSPEEEARLAELEAKHQPKDDGGPLTPDEVDRLNALDAKYAPKEGSLGDSVEAVGRDRKSVV